ncbi:MAG TPA: hypothetical protein DIV79_12895 [Opitutae bacterium]|nr:hypothetical protein [Opitutaceae bacterium]HCR30903.1 hypothetical protein [Opitutae bacterium]
MLYVERLFESLQPLYNQPWLPYALGVIGVIFAYSVFKTLSKLPKLVMYPIIGTTCFIICMSWVYHRNEPEMLTPIVDAIAPWLPGKV